MSGISQLQLQRFRARALGWVRDNARSFRSSADGSSSALLSELKPLSELALTLEILRGDREIGASRTGVSKVFGELRALVLAELGEGEKLCALLRDHPDMIALASLHASASELGFRSPQLDGLIRYFVRSGSVAVVELPAWRGLDVVRTFERLGIDSPWPGMHLIDDTWLGRMPDPWLLTDGAAYSLTHTVFYATDFGRLPGGLPSSLRHYLRRWLPAWCAVYERRQNYDILGELLMVAECLGYRLALAPYWECLLRAQCADGSVPGPAVFSKEIDRRVIPRRHARFVRDYHTTLVGVLAATLALRYGRSLDDRQGSRMDLARQLQRLVALATTSTRGTATRRRSRSETSSAHRQAPTRSCRS